MFFKYTKNSLQFYVHICRRLASLSYKLVLSCISKWMKQKEMEEIPMFTLYVQTNTQTKRRESNKILCLLFSSHFIPHYTSSVVFVIFCIALHFSRFIYVTFRSVRVQICYDVQERLEKERNLFVWIMRHKE